MSDATSSARAAERTLHTSVGDFPLREYRFGGSGREWTVLHTDAVISHADESRFLERQGTALPYGVVLWPAAIALAHEVASRAEAFAGARLLELGAGTGLPGIVAATFGAHVVQTDRQPLSLRVCADNGVRNGIDGIEYRAADWTCWTDEARYEWILGSDILYAPALHADLRRIFERNLAAGGRVLLSDPFRASSLPLLEAMEADGWTVSLSRWTVGEGEDARSVGVYELAAPAPAGGG